LGRLAAQLGGRAAGRFDNRVRTAAATMIELGGDAEVSRVEGIMNSRVRVPARPPCPSDRACSAMEALVSEITGAKATTSRAWRTTALLFRD
jgi:hypothetical protein